MTQAVAQILEEVERLSFGERAELADHLSDLLFSEVPPEIEVAHLSEVRRRIAEVESGAVTLIPGEEALARVRQMITVARAAG